MIGMTKYAILAIKEAFTKKFRTFDPHPFKIQLKVLKEVIIILTIT